MYDIYRRDRQVFVRELFRFWPLYLLVLVVLLNALWYSPIAIFIGSAVIAWAVVSAYKRSVNKRFHNQKFFLLWNACKDRLRRFHEAMAESKKSGVPELQELPKTVESVNDTLYVALRRADIVMREVAASEGWLVANRPVVGPISPDQRAQELYRLADKNIAEYRQHYQLVMSGVERTEAQAVVFTTTLDTLRIRILGHRLAGRSPELEHKEFLQALTEARMQLDSIDKALDELELTPFPGMEELRLEDSDIVGEASPMEGPPPIPSDLREQLEKEAAERELDSGDR